MNAITKIRPPKTSFDWQSSANLWTFAGLVLTAIACAWVATRPSPEPPRSAQLTHTVAGESTIAPVDERIELAQVGTAVWSHNPSGEEDLQFGDKVDQATWKHLVLRSYKKDGSVCDINLLRPDWWIEDKAAEKGGTVYVSVPECGIDGEAEVLEIRPCPPIQHCPPGYRTITGTFHHQNARVIDLYIEGLDEPIGTTPNHPFWSVDREKFVRADELHPDECLLGLSGQVAIAAVKVRSARSSVHNLETSVTHAYCVGPLGALVHNTCAVANVSELRGRQLKHEFTGNKIKRFRRDMKADGYGAFPPIRIAIIDGKKIIVDGHHRARAAGAAGIKTVPVEIVELPPDVAREFFGQAAEAAERLGLPF